MVGKVMALIWVNLCGFMVNRAVSFYGLGFMRIDGINLRFKFK